MWCNCHIDRKPVPSRWTSRCFFVIKLWKLLGLPFKKYYYLLLFVCLAGPGLSWGLQDLPSSLCRWDLCCGMQALSCSMLDLIPWPGIKPGSPSLGSCSLSHWTTREIPGSPFCKCVWPRYEQDKFLQEEFQKPGVTGSDSLREVMASLYFY